MKTMKFLIIAAVASSTAHATTLSNVKGDVRVSHGEGFVKVDGATDLAPGDKIRVGQKAAAKLVYTDGCSFTVPAGALATVAKQSPCSFQAQVGGGSQSPEEFCTEKPWVCGLLVLGTAGVGGGIAAAVSSSSGSSSPLFIPPVASRPASF